MQALELLMEVIAALGRLPDPIEFAGTQAVVERFGSLKRAFAVIRGITDAELWESIAQRRYLNDHTSVVRPGRSAMDFLSFDMWAN